jgi:hypothetical protein
MWLVDALNVEDATMALVAVAVVVALYPRSTERAGV